MKKAYSDRKVSTLLEYVFILVLLCMIEKDKKWIPPGLSIEILRYSLNRYVSDKFHIIFKIYKKEFRFKSNLFYTVNLKII